MKALTSSPSLDFVPCNQTVALGSRAKFGIAQLGVRQGIVADQRRPGCGFCFSVSFPNKSLRAIYASAAPAPAPAAPATSPSNAEGLAIQAITSEVTNTVQVKFKLHKECAYGQQFLIVGDDPALGTWDPAGGVPLNWSDGHVWTAQVDMPINRLIKYKFILKGATGIITWQPGPDRILKTWNTEKAISVSEDWYNPELQNIVEEELTTDLMMGALISSNSLTAAASNDDDQKTPATNDQGTADAIIEDRNANGVPIVVEKPLALPTLAENIAELSSDDKLPSPTLVDLTLENNDMAVTAGNNLFSTEDGTRLLKDENVPVVVPGLGSMPQEDIAEPVLLLAQSEKSILDKTATGTAAPASTSYEIGVLAESKYGSVSASASALHSTESNETISEEQQPPYAKEQAENILEADMQWGKQTLEISIQFWIPVMVVLGRQHHPC